MNSHLKIRDFKQMTVIWCLGTLATVSLPLNTELQSLYQMAEKDMIPPDYDIRKILENLLYQLKEKGILTPDNVKNTIDEGKLIPS
jgi:hypothetical protein